MIYVTENGVSEKMMCTELCDEWRIQYFRDYINEMLKGRFSFRCKHTCAFLMCDHNPTVLCGVFPSDQRRSQREGLHGLVPA